MSEGSKTPDFGAVCWADLTVDDADGIREFYSKVAGWTATPVPMGDYSDFNMNTPDTNRTVAGICYRKGPNSDIPPVWMLYIAVRDIELAVKRCRELGGTVEREPGEVTGQGRFCILRDPAGAAVALFEPA